MEARPGWPRRRPWGWGVVEPTLQWPLPYQVRWYLSLEQELEQSPGRCQVSVDGVPGGGGQRSGRSESF